MQNSELNFHDLLIVGNRSILPDTIEPSRKYAGIIPMPKPPTLFELSSPQVVKALDVIRTSLNDETHSEFYLFAREYPRCYRHHVDHAQH